MQKYKKLVKLEIPTFEQKEIPTFMQQHLCRMKGLIVALLFTYLNREKEKKEKHRKRYKEKKVRIQTRLFE